MRTRIILVLILLKMKEKNNNDSSGGDLDKDVKISIIVICVLGIPCFLSWLYNLCCSLDVGSKSSGNSNNNSGRVIVDVGAVISSTAVRVGP